MAIETLRSKKHFKPFADLCDRDSLSERDFSPIGRHFFEEMERNYPKFELKMLYISRILSKKLKVCVRLEPARKKATKQTPGPGRPKIHPKICFSTGTSRLVRSPNLENYVVNEEVRWSCSDVRRVC